VIKENDEHIKWMSLALNQAEKSQDMDEVPVGAIVVLNHSIIGSGYNQPVSGNDPTSHAEINAIRSATQNIENYRMPDASIYVTLEPCAMCYGAIIQARISNIFFGAFDKKTGVCGTCADLSESKCFNHKPKITGGILEDECSKILRDFFKKRRVIRYTSHH